MAPTASPLLKLKQLSPELPLLRAVEEVQVLDALPVAACDLHDSATGKSSWADMIDEVDKEDEESERSTSLPRSTSEGSAGRSSCSAPAPQEAEEVAESPTATVTEKCASPRQSMPASSYETARVDASELLALAANKEQSPYVTHEDLVQMMCRLQYDEWGSLLVIPCMGDYWDNSCEHKVFWCSVTQQEAGILVAPSTSAAACGITEDANGAPFQPSASTTASPTWIYGPEWPHCAAPTTLAVANLPAELTQEDFLEILDKEGFSGMYDFVHVALDPDSHQSLGNAVINFSNHSHGEIFAAALEGRTSWCGMQASPCRVSWSMPLQGIPQLITHYRHHPANSAAVPAELRPAYFKAGGFPAPFPKATA